MKFQAKISGKKSEWVEASPETLKAWSFEKRPGGWVIASRTLNGITERVRFFYQRHQKQFWAKIHGHDYFGEKSPVDRASAKGSSASDFTAQFPGKVRKIMVAENQLVEEGTPLLMIEAMKMEFAIKATERGTVKKVLVAEGQVLSPGHKLLDFEASVVEAPAGKK